MINTRILDFILRSAHNLSVLNCSSNFEYVTDLIELILTKKYCESEINLGIIYLKKTSNKNLLIVDGKRRILSLILLLKAIAICYGEKGKDYTFDEIQIHSDCLKILSSINLKLFGLEKTIYDKIFNDEPISYNEKQTEIYRTLSLFIDYIKNSDLDIVTFFEMIDSLKANIVYIDDLEERDVFYLSNRDLRPLKQILLIKSYLLDFDQGDLVNELYYLFNYKEEIFVSFFKAYLSSKFSRVISLDNQVYDYFVKYINTISKYQRFEDIVSSIMSTAKLYKNMYHAEFIDADIRNMFIKIIANNGRDTYSYLLELYEDYENKYLSKETFLEVCNIVNTYAWERTKKSAFSNENFDFTKMTEELNNVIYNENANNQNTNKKTISNLEDEEIN